MKPFEVVDGVVARPWERDDAIDVFAVVDENRERLARWMPWVPHTRSAYDVEQFIRVSQRRFTEGGGLDLGLFEGGRVLGGLGASIGQLSFDEADIGYWLAAHGEGRGVVTAAATRLISWLFDERDMHRIAIRAAVGNARSRAVADRLGFTFEGIQREALLLLGSHEDAAVYSLLRHEWKGEG